MEVIVNHKTLDNGLNVIQLETAVGAAMKNFDGGLGWLTQLFCTQERACLHSTLKLSELELLASETFFFFTDCGFSCK